MRRKVWAFLEALWPVVVLVCLFAGISRWLVGATQLSESDYGHPFIAARFISHLGWQWIGIAAVFAGIAWKSEFKILRWPDVGTWQLRAFITLLTTALAWNFSVLDYNAFYGQWHLADRILLIVCIPLVAFRPFGVIFFLSILLPFMNQFRHPGCLMFMFPEKHHLTDVLVLFTAYLILLQWKRRDWPFYFVLLSLVAAHYWPSGYVKLKMNWLLDNELSNMIFSGYANGWLASWTNDSIVRIHDLMSGCDLPLRFFTLAIELAALIFVWNRKFSLAIACSWVMLHLGIAVTSGICFLNWIILDIGIVLLLRTAILEKEKAIFTRSHLLISAVLIFFGSHWLNTSTFAWFDTRVCYTFRLSASTVSGNTYPISPNTLAPYDFAFTWNLFEYLNPDEQLPIRYGNARSAEIAKRVRQIATADELFDLEQEIGTVFFDESNSKKYRSFIQRFFAELNENPKTTWLGWIQRPADMISSSVAGAYACEEPVRSITVVHLTTLFDGKQYREIRAKELMKIDIP